MRFNQGQKRFATTRKAVGSASRLSVMHPTFRVGITGIQATRCYMGDDHQLL